MSKILLHCCCAPCAIMPYDLLCNEGYEVAPYFFNPNIHPYQEYKRRRDTFLQYFGEKTEPLIDDDYDLENFLMHVAQKPLERCGYCYDVRLKNVAEYAVKNGFTCFTTSLLVSPYQKHELIVDTAYNIAEQYGLDFVYRDFRPYFREGQNRARELELYRQPYCGCIYSEKERYCKTKK